MLSVTRFLRALRSSRADRVYQWCVQRWKRAWLPVKAASLRRWERYLAIDQRPPRWKVWWNLEWNSVHIVPGIPPWRWAWQVPWRTPRQPKPVKQHFWIQLIVLKFDFQFAITTQDKVGRPVSKLITFAALIWWYFATCA